MNIFTQQYSRKHDTSILEIIHNLLIIHSLSLATSQIENLPKGSYFEHYLLILLAELFSLCISQHSNDLNTMQKYLEISGTLALICFFALVIEILIEYNEIKKSQTKINCISEAFFNNYDFVSREKVFIITSNNSSTDDLKIEEVNSRGFLVEKQNNSAIDLIHQQFQVEQKYFLAVKTKQAQEISVGQTRTKKITMKQMITLIDDLDLKQEYNSRENMSPSIKGSIIKTNSVRAFTFVPLKLPEQSYLLILEDKAQSLVQAERFLNVNQISVGDISAQSESSFKDQIFASPQILDLKIGWQQNVNFKQRIESSNQQVEFLDDMHKKPKSEKSNFCDEINVDDMNMNAEQINQTVAMQVLQKSLGVRKSQSSKEVAQYKGQIESNTSDRSVKSRSFFPAGNDGENSEEMQKRSQLSSDSFRPLLDGLKSRTTSIEQFQMSSGIRDLTYSGQKSDQEELQSQEQSRNNTYKLSFIQAHKIAEKVPNTFEQNQFQGQIADNEILKENAELKDHIQRLQTQIETSKIFTFMVIHDLKHPTESLVEQLGHILTKLHGLEEQILDLTSQNSRIRLSSSDVSEQTLVLQRSINKIFQKLTHFESADVQNQRQILLEESKELEQPNQNVPIYQVLQRSLFESDQFHFPIMGSNQVQNHRADHELNLAPEIQYLQIQQNQEQFNESANIDLRDFEEGDKQNMEERIVSPNNNQQRLNFDIRSPQWINFIDQAQQVLEFMYQSTINGNRESLFTVRIQELMTTGVFQEFYFSASKLLLQGSQQPKTTQEVVQKFQDLSAQRVSYYIDLQVQKKETLRRANTQEQSVQAEDNTTQVKNLLNNLQNRASIVCRDVESISQKQSQLRVKFESQDYILENALKIVKKEIDTVKMLNQTSGMMKNLMMDLLDLAQMEKNTFRLNKDYFSIFEVINMAFGMVSHISQKKNVFLKPPTPETNEAQLYQQIYGDKNRFLQVIINFLSNSLKFSNQGSEIHLHLTLLEHQTLVNSDFNQQDGFVKSQNLKESSDETQKKETPSVSSNSRKTGYIEFMLSIQDFGVGIPADKLNSIFINFGNLEEHQKSNPSGRGLGLSICKSIVEQMGGKVIVESELGKGSIFSMTFKVMYQLENSSRSNSQEKSGQSEIEVFSKVEQEKQIIDTFKNDKMQDPYEELSFSMPIGEAIKNQNQPKLLLVNDEPFLLWTYEQVFQDYFQVQTAENGLQALQIVNSVPIDHFDLILLDLNMPIMDGFEACERINSYLYQEESFFVVPKPKPSKFSRFKSLCAFSDRSINNKESKIIQNQNASALKFSTKNKYSGELNSSMLLIDTSFEESIIQQRVLKRPLIYALTGDVSKLVIDKVQEYPFCGIFEKIGTIETQMLLRIIEQRKIHQETSGKMSKQPKLVQSKSEEIDVEIVSSVEKISNQKDRDLRIILERDEFNDSDVIESKNMSFGSSDGEGPNSQQSQSVENISNKAFLVSGSSQGFQEQKQLSPDTIVKRVNLKEMARIVNFSRKFGSSSKKLNEFQPTLMSSNKKSAMQKSTLKSIDVEVKLQMQLPTINNHQFISKSKPLQFEKNSISKPQPPYASMESQLVDIQ